MAELEPAAWTALRHPGNAVVEAGPGAGKTEFLAQRACYLLDTGLCPSSQRILAISFKTDAAKNLRRRVEERVSPERARRFDSMTFDAFTKQLLDRFLLALPDPFCLDMSYELAFPSRREIEEFFNSLVPPEELKEELSAIPRSTFEATVVGRHRLPATGVVVVDAATFAIRAWWAKALAGHGTARLSFTHINRLAELIVRTTPRVRTALRATYPFVFVDECQDTTVAQFDFLTSVFAATDVIVTAVGDLKQRIMGWAGAVPDAFGSLSNSFDAERFELLMNHRSVPELVSLQRCVAQRLSSAPDASDSHRFDPSSGVAEVWAFESAKSEAATIADSICLLLERDATLRPNDVALLVRSKPEAIEAALSDAFEQRGLKLTNVSARFGQLSLQDLVLDELSNFVVSLLRLLTTSRHPAAWNDVCQFAREVWAADPEDAVAARALDEFVAEFLGELRVWTDAVSPTSESFAELLARAIRFLGETELRAAVATYRTGDAFDVAVDAIKSRLESLNVAWDELADAYIGANAVPMLTIHKSKGLEYQHVFLVGLDDGPWWPRSPGEPEGLSTLFVGLSRARLSVRITTCEQRGTRYRVADLHDALTSAGVPEVFFGAPKDERL